MTQQQGAAQSAQPTGQPQAAVVKYENVADLVMKRVESFTADGGLVLPKSYSVGNNLKSAWLVLQEAVDRNSKPVLEVCTKASIANALFDMVLQGLSVSKAQGYFIAYGNKLEFQRSYFGTVALAKRVGGGIKREPVANVIYEGDEFVYTIDPQTGLFQIIKHDQKIENIDDAKIKAAYAITTFEDGRTEVTIMTIDQIKKAWNQGATKGQSPAHKNFPSEMCKKTVIGRACKMVINSSDDAWLYDGKKDEDDVDVDQRQRDAEVQGRSTAKLEDAEYEEVAVGSSAPQPQAQQPQAPQPAPAAPAGDEGPGY
ncbi:MAG: recombinase RecT [Prevotella sp.]|nr:recombinase RecT [Prevotella sp.]